ncbi:MAG TPA: tetratricopeptide repeat protein [Allosphingosinicella sp.]|jgi:tetratricopeptide (TPR) repeat protein|nr:tetratricopeptide repeat protein [Allosphingosinicella sp.]
MKSISRIALGVALVLGTASVVATAPADAQKKKKGEAAAQPSSGITLTKEERAALAPVQTAITAKDWATAQSGLTAGAAAVTSPGGRYAVGRFQVEIGLGTNNVPLQAQGIDNMIASGEVTGPELVPLLRNQAVLASNAGNKAKAEAAYARVVELSPNDPESLISLAQVKVDLKKPTEAVQLISRAIEMKRAAGQKVDESWYKYALKLAFDGRSNPALREASQKLSRDLVTAYPTKENWRDSVLIFRDTNNLDAAADLDVLRFMRASGSLAGERDWYDLIDGLYKAGNYAEAKSVLDDGAAKRMIDPKKAAFAELIRLTNARMAGDRASLNGEESKAMAAASGATALKIGDAFYGYGEHAKAIALYRAALSKGGVDANLVNTRLAMALLASGDRAGAEAAFRALTGPRQNLGAFWLAWLARSGA